MDASVKPAIYYQFLHLFNGSGGVFTESNLFFVRRSFYAFINLFIHCYGIVFSFPCIRTYFPENNIHVNICLPIGSWYINCTRDISF